MAGWRLAHSLETLRWEVNALYPSRDKSSDGTIGDTSHAASASDHNPNDAGVVCAYDLDVDIDGSDDSTVTPEFVALIEQLRLHPHPNVKYCLPSSARILCADLQWRQLGLLDVGDELIAFDEYGSNPRRDPSRRAGGARMRNAVVEALGVVRLPSRLIETDRSSIVASDDHLWLVAPPRPGMTRRWVATRDLEPGMDITYLGDPWLDAASAETGWLGGLFDGEGCLSRSAGRNGWTLSVAQRSGLVAERAKALLTGLGITYSADVRKDGMEMLRITGGIGAVMSVLGRVPTIRLRTKAIDERIWEGSRVGEQRRALVKDVRDAGTRDLAMIETSTRTLIADGYFSHNCIYNRRMFSAYPAHGVAPFTWRAYGGADPHTSHAHVSVGVGSDGHSAPGTYDDTSSWLSSRPTIPPSTKPAPEDDDVRVQAIFTVAAPHPDAGTQVLGHHGETAAVRLLDEEHSAHWQTKLGAPVALDPLEWDQLDITEPRGHHKPIG